MRPFGPGRDELKYTVWNQPTWTHSRHTSGHHAEPCLPGTLLNIKTVFTDIWIPTIRYDGGYHTEPYLPVRHQAACQWLPCRTLPTCTTSSSMSVATIPNPAYLNDIKHHASGYRIEPCLPVRHQTACQWLPYRTLPTCMTSNSMSVATIPNPAYLYDIKHHASGYRIEPCLPVRHQTACQWLPYRTLPTCMTSSSMSVATIPNPAYLYDIKKHTSGYRIEPCLPIRHQTACQWLPYRNPAYLYDIKQHASGYHTEPCLPVRHQAACQWLPYRTLPNRTTSSSMPVATIPNPAYLYDIKQHASGYHTEPCLTVRHQAACQWLPYRTLPTCTTSSSMPVATIPNPAYLYDIKQHASGYRTERCLTVRHQAACPVATEPSHA